MRLMWKKQGIMVDCKSNDNSWVMSNSNPGYLCIKYFTFSDTLYVSLKQPHTQPTSTLMSKSGCAARGIHMCTFMSLNVPGTLWHSGTAYFQTRNLFVSFFYFIWRDHPAYPCIHPRRDPHRAR